MVKDEKLTVRAGELARGLGLRELGRKVTVVWNARMRSSAGRATWPDAVVMLNPKLRELGGKGEIERTFLHELAHLVTFARYHGTRRRVQPHGREWQMACAELGIPGESATHSLPLPRRRQRKKFFYRCPGCGEVFGRVRRLRGEASCRACGEKAGRRGFCRQFRLEEVDGETLT